MVAPPVRPPPRFAPCADETEIEISVVPASESRPKPVRARLADPIRAAVRRVIPTGAVHNHVIRADDRAEVAGRVAVVHFVRRRTVHAHECHVVQRRTRGDAINDRRHARRHNPWAVGRGRHKPHTVLHAVIRVRVHTNDRRRAIDRVIQRRAFDPSELRLAVVGHRRRRFVAADRGGLRNRVGDDRFSCLGRARHGNQCVGLRMIWWNLREVGRQALVGCERPRAGQRLRFEPAASRSTRSSRCSPRP